MYSDDAVIQLLVQIECVLSLRHHPESTDDTLSFQSPVQ